MWLARLCSWAYDDHRLCFVNQGLDSLHGGTGIEFLGDNVMSVLLRDVNLPQHVARFYMHGLNSPSSPLTLQLTSTDRRKIAHLVDLKKFDTFVEQLNNTMVFSNVKRFIFVALQYLMYVTCVV